MGDRLAILKNELDMHLNAAMGVIAKMRKEATKLQSTAEVSTSALSTGLTDEEITKILGRRNKTVQNRIHKSS